MSGRRSSGSLGGSTSLVLSENLEYDNLFRDSDALSQYVSKGISYVTDVAVDLEEVDEKEEVQKMDESLRNLIDIENKLSTQKEVLERIKIRTNNGRKFDDIIEVYDQECEKAFKDYSQVSEEDKYFKNENYEEFRQKIWEVKHQNEPMPSLNQNDDDDIVIGHQKDSLTCPITTLPFENPVTSDLCKHSFSKEAILSLIKQSGNVVPCPIPGCEKQIMEHNLKENRRLERKVAQEYKKKKKSNKMDDVEYTSIDD